VTSGPSETRLAARAVILAPTGRLLLLHHRGPHRPFWATPGGGLEPGESFEEAARRELREETGLDAPLGPWIWEDRFDLFGTARVQVERFFLVRVGAEPLPAGVEAFHAAEGIDGARWWSAAELDATAEPVFPERLGGLLRRLLDEGAPGEAIVLG
jgi:ADP-ribose pyrophosphatase YjhB (NUDIX family)